MYRIIGGDQREYGPVSDEQVIQWIREGRANGETKVRAEEGGEWTPLSALPQFAAAFQEKLGTPPPVGSSSAGNPQPSEHDLRARDSDFSIPDVFGEGWELLTKNFGLLFASTAIFLVINAVMTVMGIIPILGLLFSLCGFIVTGPLVGGLIRVFLRTRRGMPTEVGDVFSGFRGPFVSLMLTYVVMTILILLSCLPGALLAGVGGAMFGIMNTGGGMLQWLAIAAGSILVLVPALFLSVSWMFSLPLVVDREMHFWDAMQLSMAVVRRRWLKLFLLSIVLAFLYLVGIALCLIGVFVTVPLAIAIYTLAYEKMFS